MTIRKQARSRARPGTGGSGRYYRVEVRPKGGFEIFRYQDVGRPGHVKRLAGKRPSGTWADAAWLISKTDAHVRNGVLVADTPGARKVLKNIGPARLVSGSLFRGHPRKNVPEGAKSTPAQRRARAQNIRKARAARRERGS